METPNKGTPEESAPLTDNSIVVGAKATPDGSKKHEIRDAYKSGDIEASIKAHAANVGFAAAPEHHGGIGSNYIKSVIFGGLDGSITTFSTIASVVGGSLPIQIVITLGFANLIADAISMGMGDTISSRAEAMYLRDEKKREIWELENYPEGERAEMVDILVTKGFDHGDAKEIIDIMSQEKHKEFFVDYMMVEELGLQVPTDAWEPFKEGLITFGSFMLFGSIPMWVYIGTYTGGYHNSSGTFGIAAMSTAFTLFALGYLQGHISRQNRVWSGLLMMVNGSMASAAAYLVSWGILQILPGVKEC